MFNRLAYVVVKGALCASLAGPCFAVGCSTPPATPSQGGSGDIPPITFPTNRPSRPLDQPPPLSGGTLIVAKDGHTAVAADPDRDMIWIVDTQSAVLLAQVPLLPGDEPGRLVEDSVGRVHVALRGAGALVTVDLMAGAVVNRRLACPAPRGVAYDYPTDRVHVACAGGELVSFPAVGGAAVRKVLLGPDLRDVLVTGSKTVSRLYVTRFRSAELLELDESGQVVASSRPGDFPSLNGDNTTDLMTSEVAWRTRVLPDGSIAMLHQRASTSAVPIEKGGYSGSGKCGPGRVHGALSLMGPGSSLAPPIPGIGLPIDFAVSPDGTAVTVVSGIQGQGGLNYVSGTISDLSLAMGCANITPGADSASQVISAAYDGSGTLILQEREPPAIHVVSSAGGSTVPLPGVTVSSGGFNVFHQQTQSGLACASCHPEAGDDGHVWTFESAGPRRTLTLRGGLLGTEPFHWDGDLPDFASLMQTVFVSRMSGQAGSFDTVDLSHWLDAQPALPASPSGSTDAIARGAALFADPQVGCATCHSGPKFTNNQTMDVGTGKAFQVPSLIGVALRGPFMHDGCVARLANRFQPCGGAMHGATANLTDDQRADLVAYMESL